MPRPKSILWVDDEIDGLAAHRRFLETQGFTVASAAHGDDALALLRRQPYSVVLLDEQMPGRRGLELIGEIRAIDPAMPVVMVTQSERSEEHTSELQSPCNLVCRLLLEKKKKGEQVLTRAVEEMDSAGAARRHRSR